MFEALALGLPTAIFVIKAECLHWVNQAFADLLGEPREALAGRPFAEHTSPEDIEQVTQRHRRRLAGEDVPARYDFQLLRSDGARVPVQLEVRVIEWSGERLSVGSVTDISAQRRAEQYLTTIARGAPLVVSAYDREGVITLHIGRGLEKLGLEENQLVGVSVFEAFKGADEALSRIRDALAGRESSNTQDLGETVWDNWFSPLRGQSGEFTGAISISTDVTDRERVRGELQRRVEIIESQAHAIRSMAAPIIQVWEDVLVLPVVGDLDHERAAEMTERLLAELSARHSNYVILDLTGVESIDSSTASMLFKMLSAAKLLGVRGLLSGIRPEVAQALVTVGIDLSQLTTVATLHDGLRRCMDKR